MRARILATALLLSCNNELIVGGTGISGGTEGTTGDTATSTGTGTDTDDAVAPKYTCETTTNLLPSSIGCSFVAGMHLAGGAVMVNMGAEVATVTVSGGVTGAQQLEIPPGESEFIIWAPTTDVFEGTIASGFARFIDSDQPLQAWQFTPPTPGVDNDASLLLPTSTLGTKHRLASYAGGNIAVPSDVKPGTNELGKGAFQTLVVHATEDNTTVTVSLVAPAAKTGEFSPVVLDVAGGTPTGSVTLNHGETLILTDSYDVYEGPPQDFDWTGSVVEADKPIAVFMASVSMVPWDFAGLDPDEICCQDTMSAAVPPTTVLGTRYVGVKTAQLGAEFDVFRVVANEDDTEITITGDESHTFSLAEGEFAEFRSRGAFVAEGNKAFLAAQYLTSSHVGQPTGVGGIESYDCGHVETPGDPGMSVLFATENWLDEYVFVLEAAGVGGGWCNDHATITTTLSAWETVTLGDDPLPAPTPIGTSDFGYARVPLDGSIFRLVAPAGLGVQLDVYGFRDDGSYMYPGGVRLDPINPVP